MILKVFKRRGFALSIADAYNALVSLYSTQNYSKQKAAGALGGAVNGGTLVLKNGCYIRVK